MAVVERRVLSKENLSLQGNVLTFCEFKGKDGAEEKYCVIRAGAYESLVYSLACQVLDSGQQFDLVISVIRGGSIPSRQMADRLGDLPIIPLTAVSGYTPDHHRLPPKIVQGLPSKENVEVDLQTQGRFKPGQSISRVLLVEEIVDDGLTRQAILTHLKEKWGLNQTENQVMLAALAVKDKTGCQEVNFSSLTVSADTWVIFHWEVCETICGLKKRWQEYKLPEEEIITRFKQLGFSEADIQRYWLEK